MSAQTATVSPASSTQSQQAPISAAPGQGNQLLNSRGGAQVWGRKVEPVAESIQPPVVSTQVQSSSSTGQVGPSHVLPTQAAPPVAVASAPRELTEKERQAAALFGGLTAGNKTAGPKRKSVVSGSESAGVAVSSHTQPSPSPTKTSAHSDLFDLLDTSSVLHASPPVPVPPVPVPPVPTAHIPTPLATVDSILDFGHIPIHPPTSVPQLSSPPVSDAFAALSVNSSVSIGFAGLPSGPTSNAIPLKFSTAEFGQRWGHLPADVKQSTPCRLRTLEQLRQAIPSAHYGHVESIPVTMEAIYAATIGAATIVLLHVKLIVSRGQLDIIVKSNTKDVCAHEASVVISAISNFQG